MVKWNIIRVNLRFFNLFVQSVSIIMNEISLPREQKMINKHIVGTISRNIDISSYHYIIFLIVYGENYFVTRKKNQFWSVYEKCVFYDDNKRIQVRNENLRKMWLFYKLQFQTVCQFFCNTIKMPICILEWFISC